VRRKHRASLVFVASPLRLGSQFHSARRNLRFLYRQLRAVHKYASIYERAERGNSLPPFKTGMAAQSKDEYDDDQE
jgi:hypothetical protein